MKALLEIFDSNKGPQVGQRAPTVKAVDENGVMVDLGEAYRRGPVLIYFYLRAGTPVCTAQACRFRDGFGQLEASAVQIFGVSGDPPARLKQFRAKHRLPFRLLANSDNQITSAFGVPSLFGFPARRAFLIRDGAITWKGHASDSSAIFTVLRQGSQLVVTPEFS